MYLTKFEIMNTNNTVETGVQGATPTEEKIKSISISIVQKEVAIMSTELKGNTDDFSGDKAVKSIVRNISGYLYKMLLIRKRTGLKIGMNLSESFSFRFKIGNKVVDTLTAQNTLNIPLKVGYQSVRRKRFESVLTVIVEEVLTGKNRLFTEKEVNALGARIDDLLSAEKAVKSLIRSAKVTPSKASLEPVK